MVCLASLSSYEGGKRDTFIRENRYKRQSGVEGLRVLFILRSSAGRRT